MNPHSIAIRQASGRPQQLILLFHGVGATPQSVDALPSVGHEINAEMIELTVERLRGHIPKRLWDEALRAPGARERE